MGDEGEGSGAGHSVAGQISEAGGFWKISSGMAVDGQLICYWELVGQKVDLD